MDLGLAGRVALVTGASRGIGAAIAAGLAAEGCRVAICARGEEALRETAARIGAGGAEVLPLVADLSAVGEAESTSASVIEMSQAAKKINAIVDLINDIAEQTNLLALNATIEAARAGEAGKGFAVVASEVKSLSDQTAKATEEISAQVAAMQAATTTSVGAINGIAETIRQVAQIATAIAGAVEEQSTATREIAINVAQAADGTQQVSGSIEGVSEAARQSSAASGDLLQASAELSRQGEELRTTIERLVNR